MNQLKFFNGILNRFTYLSIFFYGLMMISSYLNMDETIIDGFQSAGTLTLGAMIAIAQDKSDDEPTTEEEEYLPLP